MIVYFKNAIDGKTIDLGAFGRSGIDVPSVDIPLKGDTIKDDFGRCWEVSARKHYWDGLIHTMTLYLSLF